MWKPYNKTFLEFQQDFFLELRGMEIEFVDEMGIKVKYLIGDVCDNGSIGIHQYNAISPNFIVLNYREWDFDRKAPLILKVP